jgi:hypothetical protein
VKRVLAAAALSAVMLCGCGAANSAVLLTINASGPSTSGAFEPDRAWSVAYRWDCTGAVARGKPVAQGLSWDVYNGDDATYAADNPHVQVKGTKGNGTVRYAMAGSYYLSISSACDYVIQVRPQ